ncbi:MAG: hypothetical protein D4R67_02370 [Bacteroidetes bacterium]|nr:MAG: hypothetical protein D4R67_02370 [Bacteroidota bacterium]
MHPDILTPTQVELLPLLKEFRRSFYLVGGTAFALHLGHRRSIDFDLFCHSPLKKSRIRNKLMKFRYHQKPLSEDIDQLHLMIHSVKVTFFQFPYSIEHPLVFDSIITLPALLTLSSMKAFALGRRAKWKDYVDLYFILKGYYSVSEISAEGEKNFPGQFSEKLFREQLAFHKDIDYSEPIEYIGPPIPDDEIREFLIERAIDLEN